MKVLSIGTKLHSQRTTKVANNQLNREAIKDQLQALDSQKQPLSVFLKTLRQGGYSTAADVLQQFATSQQILSDQYNTGLLGTSLYAIGNQSGIESYQTRLGHR